MLIFFDSEVNLDKNSITIVKKRVYLPVAFVIDENLAMDFFVVILYFLEYF